jgi:hypothetical protein
MPTTIARPLRKDLLPRRIFSRCKALITLSLCRQRQAGRAFLQDCLWLPKPGYSGPETGTKRRQAMRSARTNLPFC